MKSECGSFIWSLKMESSTHPRYDVTLYRWNLVWIVRANWMLERWWREVGNRITHTHMLYVRYVRPHFRIEGREKLRKNSDKIWRWTNAISQSQLYGSDSLSFKCCLLFQRLHMTIHVNVKLSHFLQHKIVMHKKSSVCSGVTTTYPLKGGDRVLEKQYNNKINEKKRNTPIFLE